MSSDESTMLIVLGIILILFGIGKCIKLLTEIVAHLKYKADLE